MDREFIKATHYFGRCSMGNFWNTFERSLVDSDFQKIKDYGFNTIILLVPWASFQPSMKPIEWNNDYFERLVFLLENAKKYNLRVVLRVGYLWENDKLQRSTYQRYPMIHRVDFVLDAWKKYIEKLVLVTQNYDVDYFLCWEDFYWPVLRHPENLIKEKQIEFSRKLGFNFFLKERYSISLFNHRYGLEVENFSEVPAPTFQDQWYDEFVLFFDRSIVEKIILWTKDMLILKNLNLIYEHRIDPDIFLPKSGNEEKRSIEHSTYKSCVDIDALYYHPKVGRLSSEVYKTAEEAMKHMERFLDTFKANNVFKGKPFLDQFNFKVQNPKHPDFSLVRGEYLEEYLTLLQPLFKKYLSGYGMWGWQDWHDDKIFNGAFELKKVGWKGKFTIDPIRNMAILNKDDSIEQSIKQPLKGAILFIEYEIDIDSVVLSIFESDKTYDLSLLKGKSQIEYTYQSESIETIKFKVETGSIHINKIMCYSHTFSNGMLDVNGEDTKSSLFLKKFNNGF